MKTSCKALLTVLAACGLQPAAVKAQLNPFGAMYFQNQYAGNPALAGIKPGLYVNLGARSQFTSVPGAPTTQIMTAEYGRGNVGIGINLNNDAAGLLKRTRAMGSYAYHLPLDDNGKAFSFGVSLGIMNERIENSEINGDTGDQSVGRYNSRDTYIDGDFGLAYTASRLTLQLAVPNVKNFLNRDSRNIAADYAVFMTAASYRLSLKDELEGIELEPKVCFRTVHGFKNILDAGTAIWMNENKMMLQVMAHSSKSVTAGIALNYWPRVSVLGIYTSETAALRTYATGNFEIGLRIKAF